ncbi:SWIM zinc finger family protein [Skermania piniformis]|uniref:SWIM zinc finger family protein n=1 Tax=Skermania pinensis TaxID=39122 RepID=A0ABX8SDM9_9ACTN|nr:SWIM zinc finger family protein [Skermania piniformis]QXQ14720.1 SWIM zinc finger family protein [Skermania piniformis]
MSSPGPRDFSRYGTRRPVRGGIEARSRRGGFGRNWWSRAFVELLEQVADSGRAGRGRTYARQGQVVTMQIEPGMVVAEVQGSQPQPFLVELRVRRLDESASAELTEAIRATPGMLAEIVSGVLPESLGELLMPTGADLDFDCSCPDPGWPCKHAVALGYLAAERLDEAPIEMLTVRGVVLDTLISDVETGATVDPDDPFGDRSVLPALPSPAYRPAPDDLDPVLLRKALRSTAEDERTVAAGLRDLAGLYRRLRD